MTDTGDEERRRGTTSANITGLSSVSSINPTSILNELQSRLGVHSVNVGNMIANGTNAFVSLIITAMTWIYLAAELGILIGALVWVVGSLFHQRTWRATGGRIVIFSLMGFVIGMIGPGVVLSINKAF